MITFFAKNKLRDFFLSRKPIAVENNSMTFCVTRKATKAAAVPNWETFQQPFAAVKNWIIEFLSLIGALEQGMAWFGCGAYN